MSSNKESDFIWAVRSGKLQNVKETVGVNGISCSQSKGYVLLREAVKADYTDIAMYLLSLGSYVNSKASNIKLTNTPLHYASLKGNTEIVEMLLNRHANIDAVNDLGQTPLCLAILMCHERIVELLLMKGSNVRGLCDRGKTYLQIAVNIPKPNLKIIELLLNYGASVNAVSSSNYCAACTPLHLAATVNTEADVIKYLLDHGANVDALDNDGKTVLQIAANKNNVAMVKVILLYHPDINNIANKTALVDAVVLNYSSSEIVQCLIDYGFSISADFISNRKLFKVSIEKNYLKIVEELINHGADINLIIDDNSGFSLIHTAVKAKNKEMCEFLLSNKADVNVKDKNSKCPIFYAIENGDISITQLLLSYGANIKENVIDAFNTAIEKECLELVKLILQHDEFDVNTTDKLGKTPLHYTALSRRDNSLSSSYSSYSYEKAYNNDSIKEEIAKLLLNRGADVNACTKNGITTLLAAAKNGFKKVVETLIEHKADVHAQQNGGQSALYFAVTEGHKEIVEILLKSSCDVNIKTKDDNTLLHIASEKGFLSIFELILKAGADFLLKNKNGKTVLHLACEKGHAQIVEVLLEFRCNVSTCNIDKYDEYLNFTDSQDLSHLTPLMIAAGKGFEEVVELVLSFGADANMVDSCGRTALHLASEKGCVNIIDILLKYGSDVNLITKDGLTPLDCARKGSIRISNTPIRVRQRQPYYERTFYNGEPRGYDCDCDYGDPYCDHEVFSYSYDEYDDDYEYDYFDDSRGINGCEEVIRILKLHLSKLYVAGLCDKRYNALMIQSFLSENEDFVKDCSSELKRMKSCTVVSDISFHDIVTKSVNQLAVYARNDIVVVKVDSFYYEYRFPIYCRIIYNRMKMGVKRKDLLEDCSKSLCSDVSSNLSRLPSTCIEKILFNLSNDHLKVLMNACKP